MQTFGIILAAGSGIRMGTPKAFLSLNGKPMLWYSLQAFEKASQISKIIVVSQKGDMEAVQNLCRSSQMTKFHSVVPGGKERQDSVREGLKALPPSAKIIAVHDSARPLISSTLIDLLVKEAKGKKAVVPAIKVNDTIKQTAEQQIIKTLDRRALYQAQTPQVFQLDFFKQAVDKAFNENFYGTDCSQVMEHAGFLVYILAGDPKNLKITTPDDLLLAEFLLRTSMANSPMTDEAQVMMSPE
jgi:2-C-methyl-D-erythritol 4-phosphate cytidylyltransferase